MTGCKEREADGPPLARTAWWIRLPVYRSRFALCAAKHSLQYTGLSPLGWKGTLAVLPHAEQTASYICLTPPVLLALRFLRHSEHLEGSFWKPWVA